MATIPRESGSFHSQLATVHANLRLQLPGIERIAVAIYDESTDLLRTFLHSTDGPVPFSLLESRLADVPSLARLAAAHEDRVLNDLSRLASSGATHTRLLVERGFRSSYTLPFYEHGRLRGFVFFDSTETGFFTPAVVRHLATFAHLVSLLVLEALAPANVLRSAIEVARELTHLHDSETGAHLDRMARYSGLIAGAVAGREGRDEEFVEFVLLFAPLHDIGKIAIPEDVLLKPARLDADEIALMRTHVERGVVLIESMASAFGLGRMEHLDVLFNIVRYHHECWDGSGYPNGIADRAIPLEARIVSVADVFDALTTERPYKQAWTNDQAFAFLEEEAGRRFDPECVHAFVTERSRVAEIQSLFRLPEDRLVGFREAYLDEW